MLCVSPGGLEPPTSDLSDPCSDQLSYGDMEQKEGDSNPRAPMGLSLSRTAP